MAIRNDNRMAAHNDALRIDHTPLVSNMKFPMADSLGESVKAPEIVTATVAWGNDQATPYEQDAKFDFRPWDGAAAFQRAVMRLFGIDASGVTIPASIFSAAQPPKLVTIDGQKLVYADGNGKQWTERQLLSQKMTPLDDLIDLAVANGTYAPTRYSESHRDEVAQHLLRAWKVVKCIEDKIQVPWGLVEIPALGVASLQSVMDSDLGMVFSLSITAPRSEKQLVKDLFTIIEDELQKRSIYKGRAIDSGQVDPKFYDPFVVDRNKIIYTKTLEHQIELRVLNSVKFTDEARKLGLLKCQVLLSGDYGTGKSLTLQYCAQVGLQNGWTIIRYAPGKDDIAEVFRVAKMYSPSMVIVEDADTFTDSSDPKAVTSLLDAFDGPLTKGVEIMTIMTTNHPEAITKGMVRPGRIDILVEFTPLDRPGVEALYKVKISNLDENINWDRVYEVNKDYTPAFIAGAVDTVNTYHLGNSGAVTEDDIFMASEALRAQFKLYSSADEASRKRITIEDNIRQTVQVAMTEMEGTNSQIGETRYRISE